MHQLRYSFFVPTKVSVPTFMQFFGFLRSISTFGLSFTSLPRIPLGYARTLISRIGVLSHIECSIRAFSPKFERGIFCELFFQDKLPMTPIS